MIPGYLKRSSQEVSELTVNQSPGNVTGYLDSFEKYVTQMRSEETSEIFVKGASSKGQFLALTAGPDTNNSGCVIRFKDPRGGKDAIGSIAPRSSKPFSTSDASGKVGVSPSAGSQALVDLTLIGGNTFLPLISGQTSFTQAVDSQVYSSDQINTLNAVPDVKEKQAASMKPVVIESKTYSAVPEEGFAQYKSGADHTLAYEATVVRDTPSFQLWFNETTGDESLQTTPITVKKNTSVYVQRVLRNLTLYKRELNDPNFDNLYSIVNRDVSVYVITSLTDVDYIDYISVHDVKILGPRKIYYPGVSSSTSASVSQGNPSSLTGPIGPEMTNQDKGVQKRDSSRVVNGVDERLNVIGEWARKSTYNKTIPTRLP